MKYLSLLLLAAILLLAAACSPSQNVEESEPFVIGAIPDQDPELLQRLYGSLADYLEAELGVPVEYRPVTDYTAAVTAFRVGDLDMVWFGGLTGVQARLQVPGAQALAQRAIDEQFTSVFIANRDSGLSPLDGMDDLAQLAGHTFTFGSESSTSGRLMPQYFLQEAGISPDGFDGEVGFSGSHDTTIELVEAGSYQAGALNSQVWDSRVAEGEVDLERVQEIWRTPPYHDYHWVMRPDVQERFGEAFPQQVTEALLALDAANPEHSEILELFGAERFIETENGNYAQIEAIGRQIGQIVESE